MIIGACDACLRRALLIERLAPHIERVATGGGRRGSPELLALEDDRLASAVGGRRAGEILTDARAASARDLRRRVDAARCWTTCRHHAAYPAALLDLGDEVPAALFGRGEWEALAGLDSTTAATIVGARRASVYGLGVAEELGRMLARAGLVVISGLANGVDSRAHLGALDGEGVTIAVLGGGADVPYPRRQAGIYRRIVASGGLVVSELPPGAAPFRWCFPARNRIMAALGGITVVVEAAERSGSLITAGMALDLGRSVGAVPGPVNSWMSTGTNQLLVDGAVPVRDAQDVLDHLLGAGSLNVRELGPELDPQLRSILEHVAAGHRTCDAVAVAADAPVQVTATALTRLELLGYLTSSHAGRYSRTQMVVPERADPGLPSGA
jgi:DNA processing protein